MKQPELGKTITQLRKAKGLTQEELVEKCKLNVRTLQRIEAGEVMPRSFTLKTIFAALEYKMNASFWHSDPPSGRPEWATPVWLEQFYLYVLDLFNLKTNTMKKISILSVPTLLLVLALVTVFSKTEAQSTAEVTKVISQSNKDFVEWFNSGKIDLLASIYADDARLVERGCGKTFIQDYYKSESGKYKFQELITTNISVQDKLVFETGKWTLLMKDGIEVSGNYQAEWQLKDGKWFITKESVSPEAN